MSLYCYCGRSETPPFCDGSHALPRPRPAPEPEDAATEDGKPDVPAPAPGSPGG